MSGLETFERHRDFLAGLAYRMFASVADAEDIVQETYLRWRSAGQPELDNPRGWFTLTCTRLCLDRLKSAQHQREEYIGEWLPEPLLATDPEDVREVDESLSMALLLTIQKLRPAERAAFLLHDVFDYPFGEIAKVLNLETAHCRQLATRARTRLRADPQPSNTDQQAVERLSKAFFDALASGDLEDLRSLLADDVVLRSDGGGKVSAALQPILGVHSVLRFFDRIFVSARIPASLEPTSTWFNGAPGVILREKGTTVSAFQFRVVDSRIAAIFVQRNPEKLAGLGQGLE